MARHWNRREFLVRAGLGAAALGITGALVASACDGARGENRRSPRGELPAVLRELLGLDPEYVHLAGLLLASHPEPVRAAIESHRQEFDRNPALHLVEHFPDLEQPVRSQAADYLGTDADSVALTESTTMGLALVYAGVRLRNGQEILTTEHDHLATHGSIELRTTRTGASMRKVSLYRDSATASAEELVGSLLEAIRPETRVVGLTWVHSDTGLKLPLRAMAEGLAEHNEGREAEDRVLLCVDGVHGLGVEETRVEELGCDFFSAGTHKWFLGPRGTGVLWARREAWGEVVATIPSFSSGDSWGARMTRGGFKAFEHMWALREAFALQAELGMERVRDHVHGLARQAKEELARMHHITLLTPVDQALSAGIICFDVDGMNAHEAVAALEESGVIASVTPYNPPRARLTPAAFNTPEDIERGLAAVRELA